MSKRLLPFLRKNAPAWAIILPGLALFAYFVWGPLLENVSFSLYSVLRFERQEFVGLANYLRVFRDPAFPRALANLMKVTGADQLKMSDYGISPDDFQKAADITVDVTGIDWDRYVMSKEQIVAILERSYR